MMVEDERLLGIGCQRGTGSLRMKNVLMKDKRGGQYFLSSSFCYLLIDMYQEW